MKALKIFLFIILILGVILTGVGLIVNDGDFSSIFEDDTRTAKAIDETATVTSLNVSALADNIEFYKSEDDYLHIDYWDSEWSPFSYSCESGTAKLTQKFTIKALFHFGVFEDKTIKIYIPDSLNDNLTIDIASGKTSNHDCEINVNSLILDTSSGDIYLSDITATSIDVDLSSGDATLCGVFANNIDVNISSGELTINDAVINSASLNESSGEITLNDCTITNLSADLSSGNLIASNLISDSISTDISSGNVNIRIIGDATDYRIKFDISSGDINVSGKGISIDTSSDLTWGNGAKRINCDTSSGDIKIVFIEAAQ